ncbi:MAG: LysM peptidoglycan-binding domain-containing protein [Syntrophales bacterium]|nr:LysM peptidoglycan-binding domain-containing protein [Syntrophales bacterium]
MTKLCRAILSATLLLTGLLATPAWGLVYVSNIRHWAAPDYTRVVIDTSDEATYAVAKEGRRLTLTVKKADVAEDVPLQSFLNKPGIEKIDVTTLPDESVRIEITLTQDVEAKVFKLKKFLDKPNRIVIDLQFPEVEEKESLSRQEVKKLQKAKIVVVDAGHGGEDPGAVGKMGTREKDVVLKIAKKLRDNLNKREGYQAFLTRTGDYYVPFKKRLKIARDYGADVFVSVHADAVRNRTIRGGSAYILSTGGATNETARLLARKENLADVIGGWAGDDTIDETDIITLDMVMTNTINRSRELAQLSLRSMSDINTLKFTQVQGAPFRVLKMPEIPSVLIETAYISNPVEEKLLRTPAFQDEMAGAIAQAIVRFVPNGQPAVPVQHARAEEKAAPSAAKKEDKAEKPRQREGRALEKGREEAETAPAKKTKSPAAEPARSKKNGAVTYRVKKGDTLEKIAAAHGTTAPEIARLNNLKLKDPLWVDRKLKIPAAAVKEEEKPAPETVTYRVQKGDTLEKIALKHHTTVRTLRTLNSLKAGEPVAAGRKLKVPVEKPDEELAAEPAASSKGTAAKKSAAPEQAPKTAVYKVRKGDTLEKIAARHDTTVSELLKLNNLKMKDPLYVDRKLKVPAVEKDKGREAPAEKKTAAKAKHQASTYRVRKGDTLEKIASKHNTTIAALMKANKIKLNDPLYVNRKLIIPSEEDI